MPSLRWLGRRWYLGSDDLSVPASCTAFVRSIGGALLWLQYCDGLSPSLRQACSATHYTNTAAILLEILVIRQSTRGAVVDCESRDRAVRPLLTAHLVLSLGELCLGVWAATQVEYVATDSCGVSLFLLRASLLAYLCSIVAGLTFLATLMKSGHAHAVAHERPNQHPDSSLRPSPARTRTRTFAPLQVAAEGWAKRWIKSLCVCVRLDETAERVLVQCLTSARQPAYTPASASASVPPPPPSIPCGPPGCSCARGLVPGRAAAATVAISLRHETLDARHESHEACPRPTGVRARARADLGRHDRGTVPRLAPPGRGGAGGGGGGEGGGGGWAGGGVRSLRDLLRAPRRPHELARVGCELLGGPGSGPGGLGAAPRSLRAGRRWWWRRRWRRRRSEASSEACCVLGAARGAARHVASSLRVRLAPLRLPTLRPLLPSCASRTLFAVRSGLARQRRPWAARPLGRRRGGNTGRGCAARHSGHRGQPVLHAAR